ncbi:sensor histidine kinase [Caenimonas terrae]|uniref:histidine kinase n=1 Tax=Caenimonas terrae TaxID=696074 RepID=A0ABW0N7G2_9BURK
MKRAAQFLVLLLGVALVLALVRPHPHQQPEPGTLVVGSAVFLKSDEATPPADGAPWVPRSLPDNWRTSNPGLSGYGWYRSSFLLPQAPATPWAAYLPIVGTTYQLLVNGVEVGNGGGMSGTVVRNMGVPRLDPIEAHLLHAGENRLELRLRVAPNLRGGLGPLTLGPRSLVEPLYDADYFWRVTLPRSLNIALIFAGLLVLLLWLRRPAETIHGCFAALAIVWSIRNFHYTVSPSWVPSGLWEAYVLDSLAVVMLLLWLFVLRLTGRRHPRLERWVVRGCMAAIAVAGALALLAPQAASAIRIPWYLLCAALGAWTIAILVDFLRRSANRDRIGVWAILGAALVTLALGLSDLAVSAQLLPFGPAARMAYGAPVLLCALVFALAESYFRTYDQVRSLNADLERRVGERALELQRTHQRVRSLERVTTLAGERERLMRDMHDGIGSQLMTTLDAVEHGGAGGDQVAAMLRDCIDDLRLMIDSLEPDDESLLVALANLRYRLEPRLAAAGIALDWQAQREIGLPAPGSVLQVLRIVQEAVTNVLRHAGASRLHVRARAEAGELVLEVKDDGRGIGPAAPTDAGAARAGRGLHNMRNRAAQLGGTLRIDSTAAGTVLTLRVPMPSQHP